MANTNFDIKNLAEPFTPNHEPSLNDIEISKTAFNSYEEQVSLVIDKMKLFNSNQSLVMKLFLHSWISSIEHSRIIQVLKELNFKFIIIKRKNITDQLLSLGIGLKLNKFTNFNEYDNSIVELDNDILYSMKILQTDLKNFDNLLNKFNLSNSTTFYYETIKEDLSTFLGRNININTRYKRMSSIPSVHRVSNIENILKSLNIS
jgi:hypothetical protein